MKHLSDYTDDLTTKAMREAGAFFAFSQKQFEEKKIAGVSYTDMGAGLIARTDSAQGLRQKLADIHEAGIKADLEENGVVGVVKRELYNHEAFYTWDISSTVDALEGYDIPRETIKSIFEAQAKKELANAE